MARNSAATWLTLALLGAGGCFATREESLGEFVIDAGAESDAATPEQDASLPVEEPPAIDAALAPAPVELDAGVPTLDLDAGHASDADAGHARDGGDAGHDARTECREPWEPWECR